MNRRSGILFAVLVGLSPLAFSIVPAASGPAPAYTSSAVASEAGPRWKELSSAHRSLLGPIEKEWPRMDARSKRKWLEVAERLGTVGPTERERIQARMTEWAKLTPQQRSQMRLRYQEARQVAPASRQDRWAAYQALPPEERERLATRAAHAPHAASAASGAARRQRPGSGGVVTPKVVAPTVVQAQPGATTSLMSRRPTPSLSIPIDGPRIVASPALVDSVTLLPKRNAPRSNALPVLEPHRPHD